MTPGNIVGMAILAGLDAIAITDHQSVANCEAAMAIAEAMDGPLVLPGMEVESSEEIHLICLFPDLSSAMTMAGQVQDSLMPIKNRPDIFGEQLLFNEDDECIGHEDRLLLQACGLSCGKDDFGTGRGLHPGPPRPRKQQHAGDARTGAAGFSCRDS
jgi:hypothetical protein